MGTQRSLSILWRVILLLIGTAFVAGVIYADQVGIIQADRESAGQVVQNNTEEMIVVYSVDPDGTEWLIGGVPPGQSRPFGGTCWSELAARDAAGGLVARRGPFGDVLAEPFHDKCDVPTWVVEPPPS
jgi:hypothetical protein